MSGRLKKWIAELIGTCILVVIGCGAAAAGAGYVGTSLAFGISIIFVAYSVGRISGGHVNPAVSLGVFINGGMDWIDLIGYIVSQLIGAIAGSALLGAMLGSYKSTGANVVGILDKNGDPILWAAFVAEIVLTFLFVLAVLGITSKKEESSLGGLLIGGALAGAHLVGFGIDGTSVNPARGLSAAIFAAIGGDKTSLGQSWIYTIAPLIGGALAGLLWRFVFKKDVEGEPAPKEA